jgi:hypothetical protein
MDFDYIKNYWNSKNGIGFRIGISISIIFIGLIVSASAIYLYLRRNVGERAILSVVVDVLISAFLIYKGIESLKNLRDILKDK